MWLWEENVRQECSHYNGAVAPGPASDEVPFAVSHFLHATVDMVDGVLQNGDFHQIMHT